MHIYGPVIAQYGSGGGSSSPVEMLVHSPVFSVFLFILLILFILVVLPYWVLFNRAGQPGWATIIPIYNVWVYCKVCGRNPIVYILISIGLFVCYAMFGAIPLIGPIMAWGVSIVFALLWLVVNTDFALVYSAKPVTIALYAVMPILGSYVLMLGEHPYGGPFAKPGERVMMADPWMMAGAQGAGANITGPNITGGAPGTAHLGVSSLNSAHADRPASPGYGGPGSQPTTSPQAGTPAAPVSPVAWAPSTSPQASSHAHYDPARAQGHHHNQVSDWAMATPSSRHGAQPHSPQPHNAPAPNMASGHTSGHEAPLAASPPGPFAQPSPFGQPAPTPSVAPTPAGAPMPGTAPTPAAPGLSRAPGHVPTPGPSTSPSPKTPPAEPPKAGQVPPLAPTPPGHSPSNAEIGLPPFDPSA